MKRYKIVERTAAYKEYWIEANSFLDAKLKWGDNDSDIMNAFSSAEWELSEMSELDSIEDETGHIEYYN